MDTPDITKAQVASIIQAIIAVAIAFGVHIDAAQQVALLGLSGLLAFGLNIGDGLIRHGRSRALTAPADTDEIPYPTTTTTTPVRGAPIQ